MHHLTAPAPLISSGALAFFIYAVLLACIAGFGYSIVSTERRKRQLRQVPPERPERPEPRLVTRPYVIPRVRVRPAVEPFDWDRDRPFDWERDL